MGALEVVRQLHIHVELGDRVLLALAAIFHPNRVAYVLDAYLVDRDIAGIGAALDVHNLRGFRLRIELQYFHH